MVSHISLTGLQILNNLAKPLYWNLSKIVRETTNALLLLDLGGYNKEEDKFSALLFSLANTCNFPVVVAYSSSDYLCRKISSGFEDSSVNIRYTSFSVSEAQLFASTRNLHEHDDTLTMQTNNNPLLINIFLCANVSQNLQRLLTSILMSLKEAVEYVQDPYSLPQSIVVLEMAARNVRMSKAEYDFYASCLVVLENLVFHNGESILLSYPIFYRDIMNYLTDRKWSAFYNLSRDVKGLINGEELEKLFANYSEGSNFTVKVDGVEVTFQVPTVRSCGGPLRDVEEEVLYLLRPKHPVVDFIGKFESTLYFIQVSLQPYNQHNTKAHDLFTNRARQEFCGKTIYDYYVQKFSPISGSPVYIYVTPKTGPKEIKAPVGSPSLKLGSLSTNFLPHIYNFLSFTIETI